MAVIGKIRSYSGLLLAFIGIALAAFVMGDLFKSRVKTPDKLADISGERISYRYFTSRVDEQVNLQELNTQEKVSSDERFQIMTATWNQLLNEVIIRQQCEKIGLAVPTERNGVSGIHPDELLDQVQGDQPHPYIMQNFRDPQTGQLNRQMLSNFIGGLEQMKSEDPNTYSQWLNLETMVAQDRLRSKYFKLIESAFFVPDAIAKKTYIEQNRVAKVRILSQRITTVVDSMVTVDDEKIREFYNKNKQNYKQEESREIKYVQFDVIPSESDIHQVEVEIAELHQKLITTTDVPEFVNSMSDELYDSTYFKRGELSLYIDSLMFNNQPGYVTDVYYENDSYRCARLIGTDVRPDSVRFSHIFLSYRGANRNIPATRSKEQSEALADSLLTLLRMDPAQFEVLAMEFSDDNETKEKGGDVDWINDIPGNNLVEACIQNNPGHIQVVETPMGFHVLKVTDKTPLVKKVRVAIVSRNIMTSETTYNQLYSRASEFVAASKDLDAFLAEGNELNPRTALVRPIDPKVSVLDNSRQIIRWAYEDNREEGDVSDIFELGDKIIVAAVSKINEKGITPFEDKKEDLRPLVLNELKGEYLLDKVSLEIQGINDFNGIASKLATQIDTNDFLTFASLSIPGYGPEPEVIGSIFSLKPGQVSAPIKGRSGVFVVIVDEFIEPQETDDYSAAVSTYKSTFTSRVQNEVMSVLEEVIKIEDNRKSYY